jgi:hypothetical protein
MEYSEGGELAEETEIYGENVPSDNLSPKIKYN